METETKNPILSEDRIGKIIRSLRKQRRLTLDAMAKETGYTKGYLSKMENSEKAPPVSTLIVIAKALGVTVSQILGEEIAPVLCSVVKSDERRMMARNGTVFGYSYETLAHNYFNKKMEPYLLTIPAEPSESAVFQHQGEEMLLVVEGTMRFFHGDNEYLVETGDCIYFDAGIPHYGITADHREVKCLMVIYVP